MIRYEFASKKRGVKASAKNIDACQPAQSAQADMGRHFLQSVNFLYVTGPVYLMMPTMIGQNI